MLRILMVRKCHKWPFRCYDIKPGCWLCQMMKTMMMAVVTLSWFYRPASGNINFLYGYDIFLEGLVEKIWRFKNLFTDTFPFKIPCTLILFCIYLVWRWLAWGAGNVQVCPRTALCSLNLEELGISRENSKFFGYPQDFSVKNTLVFQPSSVP